MLHSHAFVSLEQKETDISSWSPMQTSDGIDSTARCLSPEVDEMNLFLSCSMLRNLSDVISNSSRYFLRNKRPALHKSGFKRACLPLVLATLPKSVAKALNIVHPQLQEVKVTEVDKTGKGSMRLYAQLALTSF